MKQKFALLGYPLQYSLSPLIYAEFAKQFSIDLIYELIPTPPAKFATTIRELIQNDYRGFNITAPYKQEICKYLPQKLVAVNTVTINADGSLHEITATTFFSKFIADKKIRLGELITRRPGSNPPTCIIV